MSGISQLVDLLRHNTHYNAVLAHMVSNESFIDSAVKETRLCLLQRQWDTQLLSARSQNNFLT